jgi:hypothetical protein
VIVSGCRLHKTFEAVLSWVFRAHTLSADGSKQLVVKGIRYELRPNPNLVTCFLYVSKGSDCLRLELFKLDLYMIFHRGIFLMLPTPRYTVAGNG